MDSGTFSMRTTDDDSDSEEEMQPLNLSHNHGHGQHHRPFTPPAGYLSDAAGATGSPPQLMRRRSASSSGPHSPQRGNSNRISQLREENVTRVLQKETLHEQTVTRSNNLSHSCEDLHIDTDDAAANARRRSVSPALSAPATTTAGTATTATNRPRSMVKTPSGRRQVHSSGSNRFRSASPLCRRESVGPPAKASHHPYERPSSGLSPSAFRRSPGTPSSSGGDAANGAQAGGPGFVLLSAPGGGGSLPGSPTAQAHHVQHAMLQAQAQALAMIQAQAQAQTALQPAAHQAVHLAPPLHQTARAQGLALTVAQAAPATAAPAAVEGDGVFLQPTGGPMNQAGGAVTLEEQYRHLAGAGVAVTPDGVHRPVFRSVGSNGGPARRPPRLNYGSDTDSIGSMPKTSPLVASTSVFNFPPTYGGTMEPPSPTSAPRAVSNSTIHTPTGSTPSPSLTEAAAAANAGGASRNSFFQPHPFQRQQSLPNSSVSANQPTPT